MEKKIFLIEDDQLMVLLTKKMIAITSASTTVNEFLDGQKAIDFIKKHIDRPEYLPDIILTDLHMPVMDGWGFLSEYATIEPLIKKKITLYVLSSSISPHDIERAGLFSMITGFISKPLDKQKINEILNEAVLPAYEN